MKQIECKYCDGDGWIQERENLFKWLVLLKDAWKKKICPVCNGKGFHLIPSE